MSRKCKTFSGGRILALLVMFASCTTPSTMRPRKPTPTPPGYLSCEAMLERIVEASEKCDIIRYGNLVEALNDTLSKGDVSFCAANRERANEVTGVLDYSLERMAYCEENIDAVIEARK